MTSEVERRVGVAAMDASHWSREYERFLEQCAEQGRLEVRSQGDENRQHPRFRLWSHIVWTHGEFQFSIVDLSVSGIAFDANQDFEPGRLITVRLSDLLSVQSRVIGTTELDATPMFFAARYRVRCRFDDLVEGMRFLVMVKDMQQLRIEV